MNKMTVRNSKGKKQGLSSALPRTLAMIRKPRPTSVNGQATLSSVSIKGLKLLCYKINLVTPSPNTLLWRSPDASTLQKITIGAMKTMKLIYT